MEREKQRQGEGERECEKEKRKTEKQIQQFWDRLSGNWPAQEPGSSEHLNDMNWWSSSLEHSVLNLPPISVSPYKIPVSRTVWGTWLFPSVSPLWPGRRGSVLAAQDNTSSRGRSPKEGTSSRFWKTGKKSPVWIPEEVWNDYYAKPKNFLIEINSSD